MSYRLKVDPKSRKAARFISRLQKAIQSALIASGKTQQEIATILEVDRSVINRRLKGNSNLTARSIAELAYALDKQIEFRLVDTRNCGLANAIPTQLNVVDFPMEICNLTKVGRTQPSRTMTLESVAQ